MEATRRGAVVLSPALDGGYTLIGLSRLHERLFADIPWSTSAVHQATVERAAEIGVPVINMPGWYDIDEGDSLALLQAELGGESLPFTQTELRGAPAPATRSYLAARDAPLRAKIGAMILPSRREFAASLRLDAARRFRRWHGRADQSVAVLS